jgi:hypothetical protein
MTKPFCRELKIEGEVVWKGKQREGKRLREYVIAQVTEHKMKKE